MENYVSTRTVGPTDKGHFGNIILYIITVCMDTIQTDHLDLLCLNNCVMMVFTRGSFTRGSFI